MDSLTDSYCKTPMAITAENLAEKFNISREAVDKYSYDSHIKAAQATKQKFLEDEVSPITLRKSTVAIDEHIRHEVKLEEMTKLNPVFKKGGTVTAGTSSGIVDGSTSVLVCSEAFCEKNVTFTLSFAS
eukprot:TRINITY_DN4747_c0_g1_i12.p3 TRINITY_DN4747_c0_g1~~TRINITY_DN4747_c0_g1_i12.p3  ORF type:complete len:129 (+),score=33.02 TRINITY_DN4747_c0_g1_i12:1351-1737(+)